MYLPIRERLNCFTDNKPLSPIANEAFDRANKEDHPGGQFVRSKASKKPKCLAHVFGHREIVELKLG